MCVLDSNEMPLEFKIFSIQARHDESMLNLIDVNWLKLQFYVGKLLKYVNQLI